MQAEIRRFRRDSGHIRDQPADCRRINTDKSQFLTLQEVKNIAPYPFPVPEFDAEFASAEEIPQAFEVIKAFFAVMERIRELGKYTGKFAAVDDRRQGIDEFFRIFFPAVPLMRESSEKFDGKPEIGAFLSSPWKSFMPGIW